MWQLLGLGTQKFGVLSEMVGERQDVFEMASLHRAAPVAGGSAIGIHHLAGDQAVMRWNVRLGLGKIHVVY